jgi:probable rRNA maturation factor
MGDAAKVERTLPHVCLQSGDVAEAYADDFAAGLDSSRFRVWVETAMQGAGVIETGVVTIRLVDDAESRGLNFRYRDLDAPTNVLSFPAGTDIAPGLDADEQELGDIVVCLPLVVREAADQGKSADAHLAHLVVHGVLHLVGHDHEDAGEALVMEALERRVLNDMGIQDPYTSGPQS